MNVLFLTLVNISSIHKSGLYEDLLREFTKNGHHVYVAAPVERRFGEKTHLIQEDCGTILRIKTGNIQKTNFIEKGISTLTLEHAFIKAIKTHFNNIKFDLVLYSTPPITLAGAVEYVKHRDGAQTYLLLKDIFPQNAVDLEMMKTQGPKSVIYWLFRKKEKQLYEISDFIGCMSPANIKFLLEHNPEIPQEKVELCPNSVEPIDMSASEEQRRKIRRKYRLPEDKTVFLYGGNLGKPQGIPFLIDCVRSQKRNQNVFFLVIGSGTEYEKLEEFAEKEPQDNFRLMRSLPKEEYDRLAAGCDVGMLFLDHRFTIPNFPSRLLDYMEAKLPVLAVTDPNTDVGTIAEENGFVWWCESDSTEKFSACIQSIDGTELGRMGENAYEYLKEHYSAERCYNIINSHFLR